MKHLLLFLLAALTLTASAQTQKGYVKTKGRMNSAGKVIPGKRLAGAVISVKGKNAVTSNSSGDFTLKLSGNNYILSNVRKQGYELTDIDALSKQYTYSAQNPHIIVMETSADKIDEQLMIEEKTRANLNKRIKKQQTEIAKLKAENKITQEEYRKLLVQLNEERNTNEKLIQDMVERYSKIDYDQLDAFNQEINRLILDGELTKADSMINSKGDLNARISAIKEDGKKIQEGEEALNKAKQGHQQDISNAANDCYKKFEIFKLQHQNDSAAHYVELRASLDTTNVEWLSEAGDFIDDYLAQYDKAILYYVRALNSIIYKYGQMHQNVAIIYNNIGTIYNAQRSYSKALKYHNKALNINLEMLGEKHPTLATNYNNIGYVYYSLGNYEKAIEFSQKELYIRIDLGDKTHPRVATVYNNIGFIQYVILKDWNSFSKMLPLFAYTATISNDDSPASKKGLKGKYYLLEFADWNQDSSSFIYDKIQELKGKSKHILLLKDGKITRHHFEDTVGARIEPTYVGEEEKRRIVEAYKQWKYTHEK